MTDTATDTDRDRIEQAIAEAGLRPFQEMVARNILRHENMVAAETFVKWLKGLKEVEDA